VAPWIDALNYLALVYLLGYILSQEVGYFLIDLEILLLLLWGALKLRDLLVPEYLVKWSDFTAALWQQLKKPLGMATTQIKGVGSDRSIDRDVVRVALSTFDDGCSGTPSCLRQRIFAYSSLERLDLSCTISPLKKTKELSLIPHPRQRTTPPFRSNLTRFKAGIFYKSKEA
jgi:hypothetical protein